MLRPGYEIFRYCDSELGEVSLHHHDFYEIYLFLNGSVEYSIESRIYRLLPGDILLKADKMTMAHSLELRVPLLDKELMSVAEQVPTKYLINDENTKFAFRQAAGRHLPKEWYDREKLGFPVPIKKWLREEKFYKYVRSVFERDYVGRFFDQAALLKMIDDNYAGKTDDRRKIWTVYSFLTWYDVYFVHDGTKPEVIAID